MKNTKQNTTAAELVGIYNNTNTPAHLAGEAIRRLQAEHEGQWVEAEDGSLRMK